MSAAELPPRVIESVKPDLVVWSSLWVSRHDAAIRFELARDAEGQGTDLTWALLLEKPEPDPANASLRPAAEPALSQGPPGPPAKVRSAARPGSSPSHRPTGTLSDAPIVLP